MIPPPLPFMFVNCNARILYYIQNDENTETETVYCIHSVFELSSTSPQQIQHDKNSRE